MGDEDHPSRFEEEYTHEVIMRAVRESPTPVAITGMVADFAGCSRQTARRKLGEMHDEGLLHRFDAGAAVLWWPAEDDDDPEVRTDGGLHHEVREPPNKRMAERLEYLRHITESTVSVEYHGGGVFMLESRDGNFWNSVYRTLREHNFQVQKSLGGTVFVEKGPDPRELQRRER